VELFPEDSPIGTCKRQAPNVDRFQKRPYSCFAVENGIFAKEGGLQMGVMASHHWRTRGTSARQVGLVQVTVRAQR
jgi:hypothetical protein